MNEKVYQLFLAQLYACMPKQVRLLLQDFGSAKEIWELPENMLKGLWYLTAAQREEILQTKQRGLPVILSEKLEKQGIRTVCIEDEEYPLRLKELQDYPYLLYYKGSLPDPTKRKVAIIGARNCSDYGRRCAAYYGRELGANGVEVISGMAVGVDGLSQDACVTAGGRSFAILGSGVDVIYPRGNHILYEKLCMGGGVISEYLPGTSAIAQNFPRRNRIISALSDLVLVIEAREKSGTLITVGCALDQGREVYAVPGRIEDGLSAGCNRLVRDGAGIATCAEDVLFALGIGEGTIHSGRDGSGRGSSDLTAMPASWQEGIRPKLWKLLKKHPMSTEEIYEEVKEKCPAIQELLVELMQMEIEGLIVGRGAVYSIK